MQLLLTGQSWKTPSLLSLRSNWTKLFYLAEIFLCNSDRPFSAHIEGSRRIRYVGTFDQHSSYHTFLLRLQNIYHLFNNLILIFFVLIRLPNRGLQKNCILWQSQGIWIHPPKYRLIFIPLTRVYTTPTPLHKKAKAVVRVKKSHVT